MKALCIRNVPAHVHTVLRLRAAKAGRSVEAEVRAILTEACGVAPESGLDGLDDLVQRLYGDNAPKSASADLIAERRREAVEP